MTHLRSLAVAAACLAGATAVHAQGSSPEQLKRNHEKKLESEFLKNASWILDFDEAKAAAKKAGKPIFAYFTRSYAN